jgi:hypothetical protein
MKLRRVVAVAIGALGLSLGVVLPAQAAVQSLIGSPSNGEHFIQNTSQGINATCLQNGAGAVVLSCNLTVNNVDTSQNVLNQSFGGGADSVIANAGLPTGDTGHFRIVLSTNGTGGGFDEAVVDYFVDPQPADPPTVTISSPTAGTAVNPGASLSLNSGCFAGARATLTNCDAVVTRPDGSQSNVSGSGGALPTDQSGDYNVTVSDRQDDGQTASANTSYRVNTPPKAVITAPVDGGVVNQGDVDTWGGYCAQGTGTLTDCTIDITDPNGNAAGFDGHNTPTAIRGIYHVHIHAADSNGLTDDVHTSYRVNAYPTVAITSPLQGLRVYTDTPVPAAYSCDDAEGPVASCTGPVPVGSNVDTNPAGPKSFNVKATDSDGATAEKTVSYNVYDKPTAHINGPAVNTVVNPGGAAPVFVGNCAGGVPGVTCTMTLTAPNGTTSTIASGDTLPIASYGSYKMTVHVIDDFGTEQNATRTYKVNEAPHVVNLSPVNGDIFFQGQDVTPSYSCYDNDHDGTVTDDVVVSCSGPAGPLATQDTPVGNYTYSVKAIDNDGAATTQTVSYKVVPVVGSCQGTGLELLNLPFGKTGPADPCKTADAVALKANAPLGALAPSLLLNTGVGANVIEGHTVRTKPATFAARADVADATINILGTVNLKVTGVHSTASSKLISCSTAQLTGTSTVGTLVVNGLPIKVGTAPLTVPLVVGALYLNQRVVTATGITMRAVFLDLPGTLLDVVIGESSVAPRCGTVS